MLNQLCNRIIKTSDIGLVEMLFWLAVYVALNNGLYIWGELAWLSGLAHKAEIIFIRRSYGIFCRTLTKKFVILEKFFLMTWFLSGFKFLSILGLEEQITAKLRFIHTEQIFLYCFIYYHLKKTAPCRTGPLARVHMENFHLT